VFDQFPKYHVEILLDDFNVIVGKEHIFKLKIRNESLNEISNANGIRVVNILSSPIITLSIVRCSHILTNSIGLSS
jgi:hypothetical protein